MMLLMSAMKNDPTTTPDRSSTRGSSRRPTTRLSRYTSATAASAPTNAATRHGPRARGVGRDREHRAETGAAGKAEQVGLRQRIADHRLQGGAADAETPADQEREQHPRRAKVPDDHRRGRVRAPEPGPYLGGRERDRSRAEARRCRQAATASSRIAEATAASSCRASRMRAAQLPDRQGRPRAWPVELGPASPGSGAARAPPGPPATRDARRTRRVPRDAVRMRSGSRAATASMLTVPADAATSSKRLRPPARSTSSLRKLPRPMVIGGCSHTSSSTLGASGPGRDAGRREGRVEGRRHRVGSALAVRSPGPAAEPRGRRRRARRC